MALRRSRSYTRPIGSKRDTGWLCRAQVRADDGQAGALLRSDGGDAERGQAAAGAA